MLTAFRTGIRAVHTVFFVCVKTNACLICNIYISTCDGPVNSVRKQVENELSSNHSNSKILEDFRALSGALVRFELVALLMA